MNKIKIVFWGTPVFSIPSLKLCAAKKDFDVVAVITQPDKPVGRSGELVCPPVATSARELGIPVYQPPNIKSDTNFLSPIGNYDLNVVVAYGKLIPEWAIDLPKFKTINLHPSMLPRYRGPAPIQYALLHGDIETGITIMLMDKEMDHGPILAQEKVSIQPDDTYTTLANQLSDIGAHLLVETISAYVQGAIQPRSQIHSAATVTKLLSKDDGAISWHEPQVLIFNKIRALNPWPGTFTEWQGKRLRISEIRPLSAKTLAPGEVTFADNTIHIGTKDFDIAVVRLQLEGKAEQDANAFMNGHQELNGSALPS